MFSYGIKFQFVISIIVLSLFPSSTSSRAVLGEGVLQNHCHKQCHPQLYLFTMLVLRLGWLDTVGRVGITCTATKVNHRLSYLTWTPKVKLEIGVNESNGS